MINIWADGPMGEDSAMIKAEVHFECPHCQEKVVVFLTDVDIELDQVWSHFGGEGWERAAIGSVGVYCPDEGCKKWVYLDH